MPTKAEARGWVQAAVEAISPPERLMHGELIAEAVLRLPAFEAAEIVLLYANLPDEVPTRPLVRHALEVGKGVALPRVTSPDGDMEAALIRDCAEDMNRGSFGILEPGASCRTLAPDRIDLALIPGRAFDHRGARVGRGRGYYDRFLPLLRPGVPRIGVAFSCQIFDQPIRMDDHDIHVEAIVTERGVVPVSR